MPQLIEVALPVPLRVIFTYRYGLQESPKLGARVKVPFGHRKLIGIIVALGASSALPENKLKDVIEVLDDDAFIPTELMALCQWGANYYHHPLGEALSAALPKRFREGKAIEHSYAYTLAKEGKGLPEQALARAKKQQAIIAHLLSTSYLHENDVDTKGLSKTALKSLIEKGLVERIISPDGDNPANSSSDTSSHLLRETPLELNHEQAIAVDAIRYHRYTSYLLHGTTGSGKTEVYMHAITRVLQSGRQALVLIPEIGLSPQTIGRFRKRFNVEIAELHSNVASNERAKHWIAAKTGSARIVIGTRLASLTPFADLGIIIIDEEHDKSYKQQDGFKYSARDISVYRAHQLGIPVILGSATPSLESLHNVNLGKYSQLTLTQRPGTAQPPTMIAVDLRNQRTLAGLTDTALDNISDTLSRNEQVLVFLNRRGYAPALICHSCGWNAECPACDARMTLHQHPPHLLCHHCERRRSVPQRCDQCGGNELQTAGYGTEQVEHALAKRFPSTPVIRIDRDNTRRKNGLENQLAKVSEQEASILVGTQMLAKGHHLPNLTLVVILEADQGLMSSDYRALENMGQTITQVAGRAGRAGKPGRVIVQSHTPDHPVLNSLLNKKYESFANTLLDSRRNACLPPFTKSVSIRAESKIVGNCIALLRHISELLNSEEECYSTGPAPAQPEKVAGKYRYSIEILTTSRDKLSSALKKIIPEIEHNKQTTHLNWSIEVDSLE